MHTDLIDPIVACHDLKGQQKCTRHVFEISTWDQSLSNEFSNIVAVNDVRSFVPIEVLAVSYHVPPQRAIIHTVFSSLIQWSVVATEEVHAHDCHQQHRKHDKYEKVAQRSTTSEYRLKHLKAMP